MIGIIGFESLRVMQYLEKYTKILEKNGVNYEVVYWNRNGIVQKDPRYHGYNKAMDTYVPFRNKIHLFLSYTVFIYQTILSHKYDRLIVLTTQSAIVLSPLLLTKYRNKFLFDYRDVTFERNSIYRFWVKRLFRLSKAVPISSLGFIELLGESDKYIISHNCSDFQLMEFNKNLSNKIRIVYWGMVRQVKFNKKICDVFANDDRFILTYHGEGYYKEIESYCQNQGYNNIVFTGGYERSQMRHFSKNTDILLNAYENDQQQQPALTVKLYDGMRYQIPMLVMEGSYMAEYLSSYSIAYALFLDATHTKEEVVNWYHSLSAKRIYQEYNEIKEKISNDEELFVQAIESFCKESKKKKDTKVYSTKF